MGIKLGLQIKGRTLRMYEGRVTRIFGPKEDGKVLELHYLYFQPDIIMITKSWRMKCAGTPLVEEMRHACRILVGHASVVVP
jgi:hypothetical protein